MPLLPLPPGETDLSGGDLPVASGTDVIAEFDSVHRRPEVAPVRDAFVEGFTEGFLEYQNVAAYAAAQSDPTRATGQYLEQYEEEHSVVPKSGESEDSVRARLFRAPAIVTPEALVNGVNGILADYTTGTCFLTEPELDGMFAHDGTSEWDCFVGTDPDYPDRYYADDPGLLPGGAIPWDLPRGFVLRVPDLTEPDATEAYGRIIGFVEATKGHGIPWVLITYET